METAKPIDNSKYINNTTFKKGDNRVRKPKGALSKKTLIAAKLGFAWNDLQPYMEGAGLGRYIVEMEALKGRDYIIAFTTLLDYVKPRLARIEVKTALHSEVIEIFGKELGKPTDIVDAIEVD